MIEGEPVAEECIEKVTSEEISLALTKMTKVHDTLKMWIHRRRYLKIRTARRLQLQDELLEQKVRTAEQAVFLIERCWIRYRQRQEGLKIREYLRGVPYECRRSYVKYFDLKFKTIRLKTDVEKYERRISR